MSKINHSPPWVLRALAGLGQRCKVARKVRGLTQEQLARLADVGISTVHAVEGGHEGVSVGNVMKILHALDQLHQVDDLLDPSRDPLVTQFAVNKLTKAARDET